MGSTNGAAAAQYRIAVLGASGYTGEEVVRLLALHPNFKVAALTGETQAGKVTPKPQLTADRMFVQERHIH